MNKNKKQKIDKIDFKLWQSVNNIPSLYVLTEKTKKYINNKNWYSKSNETIKEIFKDDSDLFIDLLAITSIRNSVKSNTIFALDCYYRIKHDKPLNRKYGIADKPIKINIKRVLNDKPIHGNKISKFAKCLKGDLDNIVIDVWMLKAFNINRMSPNKKDIKYIEYIINRISKKLNIKNAQVQACLWCYAKYELNNTNHKEYKDFSYYLKSFNQNILNSLKYKQIRLDV